MIKCFLLSLPVLAVAQIRILSPLSLEQDPLFDKGIIYGTTAIFGAPEYGRRTVGELVYFTPNQEHCDASDFEKYPAKPETPGSDDLKIYVVDRGGCPFDKKVRFAQKRGADAVSIVDFPCSRQREISIKDGHPDTPCRDSEAIQRIVMADTSGARDIHIPSVLISREQGERLISAITDSGRDEVGASSTDRQVVAMLLWDIPRSDFVNVDFWMSSAATDTTYFMSQFEPYATALGPLIQFTPRYAVSKMKSNEIYRTSSCFKAGDGGYYCDSQMSSLGDRVVQEDARQLCIWHATAVSETNTKTSKTVNYSPLYWQYVSLFNERCHPSRNGDHVGDFNSECSTRTMSHVGIDVEKVEWCVANMKPPQCRDGGYAKGRPECSVNLLEDQAAHQAWSPHALRINGWRYSGPLEASVVLKTICQGFSCVPDICNDVHVIRGLVVR